MNARTTVQTTLPILPPLAARSPILTERLLLRPLILSDVQALHALRSQPEVMIWTRKGVPDSSLQETQVYLAERLGVQEDSFSGAICLRSNGEMIGIGGVPRMAGELGWPTIGYLFLKETWGKGYGTEFVRGFLQAWWSLERANHEIEVDKSTIGADGEGTKEIVIAGIIEGNAASENILRKTGFRFVRTWETALRDNEPPMTIRDFAASQQDLL